MNISIKPTVATGEKLRWEGAPVPAMYEKTVKTEAAAENVQHPQILELIEESTVLKNGYVRNGFIHVGVQKFDHLPFTVGYMEWKGDHHDI